jgi:hypothetical protein
MLGLLVALGGHAVAWSQTRERRRTQVRTQTRERRRTRVRTQTRYAWPPSVDLPPRSLATRCPADGASIAPPSGVPHVAAIRRGVAADTSPRLRAPIVAPDSG